MESPIENETAVIVRDASGNISINGDGYITCVSEGGTEFQVLYKEIDFNNDSLYCNVANKSIFLKLHENENINNIVNNNVELIEENDKENAENTEIFAWTDASTKLFLYLYKEKINLVISRKIKNKKVLWQKISEEMKLKGYNVSNTQVENKFKSLERSYKNMITNNKRTGRGRASCPYETELTELLGKRHNIEPLIVSGNKGTILRKDRTPSFTCEIENIENSIDSRHINSIDILTTTNQESSNINLESSSTSLDSATIINPEPAMTSQKQLTSYQDQIKTNSKRKMGATAQVLQSCQTNIKELTDHIQKDKDNKLEVQKEILLQYKGMREVYEKSLQKIEEQLIIANSLREERNNLLKTLIVKQVNN